MAALEEEQRRQFACEMVEHLKAYAPLHAARLGDQALYGLARGGISRAGLYGFTLRGPVQLFIEMQIMLGSYFDTDPQYPWAIARLGQHGSASEMARASLLHEEADRYYSEVIGVDDRHDRAAIRRLRESVFEGLPEQDDALAPELLLRVRDVYPEKVAFAGEEPLRELFAEASLVATELGLGSSAGKATTFALMFALGHKSNVDQQFSWVAQTLLDSVGQPPLQRIRRLRTEFLTFMRTGASSSEA